MEILKFEPIFKSVIWGGTRIAQFKGVAAVGDHVGESWELSAVPGHESVVSQGTFRGATLPSLLANHGKELMGERLMNKYHGTFPLLVKLIDSSDDLSVQVHPDDTLAGERHNSAGKTEMWYSIAPAEDAYLYAGFTKHLDRAEFRREVEENAIIPSLGKYYPKQGDVFFLPAGRVHSIGRGNFVLEIQQASDITYRIYDYDRRDDKGNPRQLHVEESMEAINFDDTTPMPEINVRGAAGKFELLAECEYFRTEVGRVDADKAMNLPLAERDSFTILVAIDGQMQVADSDGNSISLRQGETALVPASTASVTISGTGTFVSTFIP